MDGHAMQCIAVTARQLQETLWHYLPSGLTHDVPRAALHSVLSRYERPHPEERPALPLTTALLALVRDVRAPPPPPARARTPSPGAPAPAPGPRGGRAPAGESPLAHGGRRTPAKEGADAACHSEPQGRRGSSLGECPAEPWTRGGGRTPPVGESPGHVPHRRARDGRGSPAWAPPTEPGAPQAPHSARTSPGPCTPSPQPPARPSARSLWQSPAGLRAATPPSRDPSPDNPRPLARPAPDVKPLSPRPLRGVRPSDLTHGLGARHTPPPTAPAKRPLGSAPLKALRPGPEALQRHDPQVFGLKAALEDFRLLVFELGESSGAPCPQDAMALFETAVDRALGLL